MTYEDLPTVPRAEELIDKAFSRAARAGRAKSGAEAQQSMLQTAGNVLSDNLQNVVTSWPDFDAVDPFYRDLADAVIPASGDTPAGVDGLRTHLSEVMWAGRQAGHIRDEYQSKLRGVDADLARKHRKQAFARLADVTREVEDDLLALGEARDTLKTLPDIRPDEPAVVIAGYPNVGKSTFVNHVTNARNEVASYPFTTTQVRVGHVERDRIRYQLIDTPGLLDRPQAERNGIERQAVSALEHLADCILVFVDASAECGYPVETQLALRDELVERFADIPVLTVCTKADRARDIDADVYLSVTEEEGVEALLDAAVEAVDYELELPFEG
ncbi:NOG1 family protein [Halomarina ordinaria]|uniref:NOG1 family protein n=1 Tax=Halomarina ordinaria TaxID=3033939 RepID=A0ABD5UEH3_9EURY|nr:GTPase [Halomarina sp. PSRA2]